MPLSNAGTALITSLIIGGAGSPFSNVNTYLGVGDSTAPFSAVQTNLQGTSFRKAMNVSYPVLSGTQLTFQATYSQSEANFAWQEWGIFNASSSGTMLNRKVEVLGTKANTQAWEMTVVLTLTNP